jgi:hypothetical protein
VKHVIAFQSKGDFAGWPANEGFWAWGNEILVGFEVARFVETDDNHNVDRNAPKRIAFARSLDGGETWKSEEHPTIQPPAYLEDPTKYVPQVPDLKKPTAHPGNIDFTHPDFAMKVRGPTFYTSTTRGRSWEGPFELPTFGHRVNMARTNYLVVNKSTCRIFVEVTPISTPPEITGERGQTLMAETTDGGKTWNKVAMLAPDPFELDTKAKVAYSIMPGLATLDDGTILAALRQRSDRKKWVELVESKDQGRTWRTISLPFENNNNPGALVRLGGKRLGIIYGYRNIPFGIRAKISEDNGKTWGKEIVLRDDGREWDLGYTRAAVRPDGKVLVVYYYTTKENPEQHIAATIWTPPTATATAAASTSTEVRR